MSLQVGTTGIRGVWKQELDVSVVRGYTAAFVTLCQNHVDGNTILVARDGRASGDTIFRQVCAEIHDAGLHITNGGRIPTPTAALAADKRDVLGAIVITASHNPPEYNGLKFLNAQGELLSYERMGWITDNVTESTHDTPADESDISTDDLLGDHIEAIAELAYVRPDAIAESDMRVVLDGINSVGGPSIKRLLRSLGIAPEDIICINCEYAQGFAHMPEPRASAAHQLQKAVHAQSADIGMLVDPDGDRLAFVDENGEYVTEELTQVIAADWIWQHDSGPFVTNLSASRAIDDVAQKYDKEVYRTPVGERYVVTRMHEVDALAGGEGTGSPIVPALHFGRDALIAAALTISYLVSEDITLSTLVSRLPTYKIVKDSIDVDTVDIDDALATLSDEYESSVLSKADGLKLELDGGWVHIRPSGTEPLVRIFAEAAVEDNARSLVNTFKNKILNTR